VQFLHALWQPFQADGTVSALTPPVARRLVT